MAFNKRVQSDQPATKFYAPGMAKQSTAPGRLERALAAVLPTDDVTATISARVPDYGFYLPGVRLSEKRE